MQLIIFLDFLFLRILLPIVLIFGANLRYNLFSFTYLCFLIGWPLLKCDNIGANKATVGRYLIALTSLSGLFTFVHIVLHLLVISPLPWIEPLLNVADNCTILDTESILQQIGIQVVSHLSAHIIFRLISPDVLVLITSSGLLIWHFYRPIPSKPSQDQDATSRGHRREPSYQESQKQKHRQVWRAFAIDYCGVVLTVFLTALASIISPSLFAMTYLVVFVLICTHWACRLKRISLVISYARMVLLVYSALHVMLHYLYQLPLFQYILPDHSDLATLFGLHYIIQTSCNKPGEIEIADCLWIDYVAPLVTLLLCLVVGMETRRWCDKFNISNPITLISYIRRRLQQNLISVVSAVHSKSNVTDRRRQRKATADLSTSLLEEVPASLETIQTNSRPDFAESSLYDSVSRHEGSSLNNSSPSAVAHSAADKLGSAVPRIAIRRPQHVGLTELEKVVEDEESRLPAVAKRPFLLSVILTAIRNSYALTLIVMMAWSVAYRSWLSFVLLISACLIWIAPNCRRVCLLCSPLIVMYAIVLLFIQYITCLTKIPTDNSTYYYYYNEIGLHKFEIPTGALAVQVMFLVIFCLTLSLFVLEGNHRTGRQVSLELEAYVFISSPNAEAYPAMDAISTPFVSQDHRTYREILALVKTFCVRYWICVCCAALLFVSIQQPVVIFRVVYMILLLYFLLTFMISYSFWRKQMLVFWWIVIIYSMIILCFIYTFQFHQIPHYWYNITHLSDLTLRDIGLQKFSSAALFQRLLTPVIFIVIIILQVHYFHKHYLRISHLDRYKDHNEERLSLSPGSNAKWQMVQSAESTCTELTTMSDFIDDVNSAFQIVCRKVAAFCRNSYYAMWRLLEVHSPKLVWILVMSHCIKEVAACNIFFVIILVLLLPFYHLKWLLTFLILLWSGLLLTAKMIIQLNIVQLTQVTTCWSPRRATNSSEFGKVDIWLGLTKSSAFVSDNMSLVLILVFAALSHGVYMSQRQLYNSPQHEEPARGIIFPEVTNRTKATTMINFVKYLFNYLFYNLGLEMCLCMSVITAGLRADALSVFYLLLIIIFLFTPRKYCARLWLPYCIVAGWLLIVQYAACLGLPPFFCVDYPWTEHYKLPLALQQWLFLPNYNNRPVARKLLADFFQFMFACHQYYAFRIEKEVGEEYGGGSNEPAMDNSLPQEPLKDFISTKDSYMDYVKHAIFCWSYWVSLVIVFLAGLTWITLFCLGYIIISFIFLWMGQGIILQERKRLITSWNFVIFYNYLVILAKASLQLMGCVYYQDLLVNWSMCWLSQMFGIQCLDPMGLGSPPSPTVNDSLCKHEHSGLHWDIICFIVIILQRKLFMTRSFSLVVIDLKVQSEFASRGAILINKELITKIERQTENEAISWQKVRDRVLGLRERQKTLGKHVPSVKEHYLVLRSGDQYLFENDPEEEDAGLYITPMKKRDDENSLSDSESDSNVTIGHPDKDGMVVRRRTIRNESISEEDKEISESIKQDTSESISKRMDSHDPHRKTSLDTSHSSQWQMKRPRIKTPSADESSYCSAELGPKEGSSSELNEISGSNASGQATPNIFFPRIQREHSDVTDAEKSRSYLGNRADASSSGTGSHRGGLFSSTGLQRGEGLLSTHPEENAEESDEENPATAPPTSGVNLFQIINQTVQKGPSTILRNYRKSAYTGPCSHNLAFRNRRQLVASSIASGSFDFGDDLEKGNKRNVPTRRTSIQLPSPSSIPSSIQSSQTSQGNSHRLKGDAFTQIHYPDTVYEERTSGVVSPRRRASVGVDRYIDNTVSRNVSEPGKHFSMDKSGPSGNHSLPAWSTKIETGEDLVLRRRPLSGHEDDFQTSLTSYDDNDVNVSTNLECTDSHSLQQEEAMCCEPDEVDADKTSQEGCWSKIKSTINLVWLILKGLIDQNVRWLNRKTRDYRDIRRTIDKEKILKKRLMIWSIQQSDTSASPSRKRALSLWLIQPKKLKARLQGRWVNTEDKKTSPHLEDVESLQGQGLSPAVSFKPPPITPNSPNQVNESNSNLNSVELGSMSTLPRNTLPRVSTNGPVKRLTGSSKELLKREKEFKRSRNLLFLFIIAVSNAVIVYSEWLCYALLLLNHLCSATVLSLPYPCMVFLWAMLSVPRPSKRFWVTLITYTEIVIVIKYIFQFRIIETLLHKYASQFINNQFFPLIRILGIERQTNYAFFDLIQLLFIFLHRGYLKNNGLWQDHSTSRKQSLEVAKDVLVTEPNGVEDIEDEEEEEETVECTEFHHRLWKRVNLIKKLQRFYAKMTDPRLNEKRDVYVYMFIMEFMAFLIIIFGYKSFGPSTAMGESAFDFIRRNNIPVPFICMLVVQFLLILLDRALFLRKNVLGKFVFLILQVIAIHAWLFFILPWITRCAFQDSLPPKLLYVVKCFYFGLSAYQIRSGYPRRTMGNFLTENYNYINLILFKCYLIVPFLYEMRNIMDWIWTDTTLALYHWMEVEDIFSKMFSLKCWRRSELEYPTLRSQLRYGYIKYIVGIFWMSLCFFCIWTPLVVSAFIGTTFVVNPPVECKFEVAIASFPTIYTFTARGDHLNFMNKQNLEHLKTCYEYDQLALAYLNYYDRQDISDIHIATQSSNVWAITPPHLAELKHRLSNGTDPLHIHFEVTCRRKVKEIGSNEQVVNFNHQRPLTRQEKSDFLTALNGSLSDELSLDEYQSTTDAVLEGQMIGKPIRLSFLAPRYVVARRDRMEELTAVSQSWNNINATLTLMWHKNTMTGEVWRWWKIEEHIERSNTTMKYEELCPVRGTRGRNISFTISDILDILNARDNHFSGNNFHVSKKKDPRLRIFSFNERVYDNLFGKVFTSYGIIGIYAAYIFVVHRILRVLYSDITYVIQYQELPNVDRILKLCSDIYMVRESDLEERLSMEEDLVARLIYLFRSNESLIKYTRHRRQLLEDYSHMPFPAYNKMTAKNFREFVPYPEPPAATSSVPDIHDSSADIPSKQFHRPSISCPT